MHAHRLLAVLAGAVLLVGGCGSGQRDAPDPAGAGALQPLGDHEGDAGGGSWAPWPQALHDARHSGASDAVGPQTGHIRWRRTLEGDVTPGPVVGADGTIYAASNAGVLHALDPATGTDLWTVDGDGGYGIDQSTSPAVLPDGIVLWPGPRSTLFAISPEGATLWTLDFPGSLVTSPAVTADGVVVVGDSSGTLRLLRPDAVGPHPQWDVALGGSSYGSPVIAPGGDTVYQTLTSGVVAVAVDTGTVRWTAHPASDIIEVSAAVAPDGTVVVGANDPFEYGLDPADGSVRWRFRTDSLTYSSPGVTDDGVVYFGDHENRITGLDAADGTQVFRYGGPMNTGDDVEIWTSVAVDAHHDTYAGTTCGLVEGVDRDGTVLFELHVGGTVDSYPALTADGALVIGTSSGELIAVADPS